METRIQQQYAQHYITSGNARVCFHNTQSGNKFWFNIKEIRNSVYSVLCVSAKGEFLHRKYLGHLNTAHGGAQFHRANDGLATELQNNAANVFAWMWLRIRLLDVPDFIHIYHEGRCGKCGRILIDPDSIQRGIGPKCRNH